jgi:N-acyl-D-amino-acid deacylase
MTFDLVIRGGTVVDGTGAPARTADVAITGDRIREVGRVDGSAKRTIEADGLLVTPGFVDIHTHYDGQITWDPLLTPTCWHGVTTVVMGNCGVGFAPARRDSHAWLVGLMEGVEDIPGTALHEGIRWEWETFPEYLDHLSGLERVVDFGTQVPHGAVRAYVMGERGAKNQPATADDIVAMARIVKEGVAAGALGFSMSRTFAHKAIDGEYVPGTTAEVDEVLGIGLTLGELGQGVVELAPAGVVGEDLNAPEREVAWMRELARRTGRPVTYALVQHNADPEAWRTMLKLATQAREDGAPLYPQVHGRSPMLLIGLETRTNPFALAPSWREVAGLPLADRAGRLRSDADLRARLVSEVKAAGGGLFARSQTSFDNMYPLGAPKPEYEPDPSTSVAAIAARSGKDPVAVMLDVIAEGDGQHLLNVPLFNFSNGSFDPVKEMLEHPTSVLGLGDGGAHCNAICDASMETWMLTHWTRDRAGDRLPVEWVVRKMSRDTAEVYGLLDRGALAPGLKADVNLIDYEALEIEAPRIAHDLPTGAPRFVQGSTGYAATIVSGQVTIEQGEPTGALPGRLLRGARPDPR